MIDGGHRTGRSNTTSACRAFWVHLGKLTLSCQELSFFATSNTSWESGKNREPRRIFFLVNLKKGFKCEKNYADVVYTSIMIYNISIRKKTTEEIRNRP